MPNKKSSQQAGNIYDRIFKENAEHLFIPLVEKLLNLNIVTYKPLQVKFTKTAEHEVDFLYEIEEANQAKQILHIEFQSTNQTAIIAA